jgi:hypothetical protein
VPEPATTTLALLGAVVAGLIARKRAKREPDVRGRKSEIGGRVKG